MYKNEFEQVSDSLIVVPISIKSIQLFSKHLI